MTQIDNTLSKRQRIILFKQQVMKRADLDGVAKASQDYGVTETKLYLWLENARMVDEMAALEKSAL